jgi:hypothetical protein
MDDYKQEEKDSPYNGYAVFVSTKAQRRDGIITEILGEAEIKKLLAVRRETITMVLSYKRDELNKDTKKIYRKQRYEMTQNKMV